ncbi:hypothetical protein FACS1894137_07080 [Spirochaetia bacterium]|nr:hypothetical protein FACS1894137_07080 [Spirochaetia bacterium]
MGGLKDRARGHDKKEWCIKDNESILYDFHEIEAKIINGEITKETLLFKPPESPSTSSYDSPKKEYKEASKYHELRSVFNRLPPT